MCIHKWGCKRLNRKNSKHLVFVQLWLKIISKLMTFQIYILTLMNNYTQERSITSVALFNEQLDQSFARNR